MSGESLGSEVSARSSDDLTSYNHEETLEGWEPVVGEGVSVEDVIDRAFDYRGDVTAIFHDGGQIAGYLFNRNAEAPEPFIQMFDRTGNGPFTIPYTKIATIRFTGKDTAAGKSYEARVRLDGELSVADAT